MGSKYEDARSKVAQHAIEVYQAKLRRKFRSKLKKMAQDIVRKAFFNRLHAQYAHNFTGNLINSIVAGVYENGKLHYYFMSEQMNNRPPIQREMTAGNNGNKPRTYHFDEDWDFQESEFAPGVVTDENYGPTHAEEFVKNYVSKSKYFEIVVAYTVCYADVVKSTSGYWETLEDFSILALTFVQVMETEMNK